MSATDAPNSTDQNTVISNSVVNPYIVIDAKPLAATHSAINTSSGSLSEHRYPTQYEKQQVNTTSSTTFVGWCREME